ncbi:MAG: type I DNA topoisomerase [Firmicutes bacterium]|nr:type I DNA topoisomerase [Bacillota bacterium]
MKLIIIEGAGKKETIEKYLGKGYRVFATKGHIRDLPQRTLAVNVKENFAPKYVVMDDKSDIVERMRAEAVKADEVLLATDPDREGEAISWHVAQILGVDPNQKIRIVFNEISKKAVTAALQNPRAIDISLVDAQQARRVLDRLVGYKLSPVLCKKIQNKLSAGRVQSATLRLVVEREREIRSFKPEEYWPFFSMLHKSGDALLVKAALFQKDGKKIKLTSRGEVDAAVAELNGKPYTVTSVKKSITRSRPPAPFITSTLQQDALNKLSYSLSQTTLIAQNLYEGVELGSEGKVALVTYVRTDSTRVAPDAINEARSFIAQTYGNEFIPEKPNFYASKKGAQDAHEAIRPISPERTPESLKGMLKKEHYRLYKLIYERFLASQMSDAQYNSLSVEIGAGAYTFKVNGKTPLFAGYTVVYSMHEDNKNEDDETAAKLPDLREGEVLNFKEYKFEQKFTKPPARYTEAALVKAMEEKGIGRPATYTPTVTILSSREYVTKKDENGKIGKFLIPTPLGEKVNDMLVKYFPDIIDVAFTAQMEENLDKIEDGGVEWQSVVAKFYDGFEEKIAHALGDGFSLKAPDVKTDIICDKCGANMHIKTGRYGRFLACPAFPKCRNTKQLDEPNANSGAVLSSGEADAPPEQDAGGNFDGAQAVTGVKTVQEQEIICDKCGKEMRLRQGKFGPFYGCTGYPACKNIKNPESKADAVPAGVCPECGKDLKKITTRKSIFYGCNGYPDCPFTSSAPVLADKCPQCGGFTVLRNYKDGAYKVCGKKDCTYKSKTDN